MASTRGAGHPDTRAWVVQGAAAVCVVSGLCVCRCCTCGQRVCSHGGKVPAVTANSYSLPAFPHNPHLSRASSLSPPPPLSRSAVGRLHRKTSELEKEAKISLDEKGDVRKVSAAIASTLDPRLSEYGLQLLLSGLENFTLSEAGGGGVGGGGGGIDDGSSPRGGAEEIAQLRAENEQLRARIMQLEVRMHVRPVRRRGKTHRCVLYTPCCVRARVHVSGCVRDLYMGGCAHSCLRSWRLSWRRNV